jgi:23S rRNA (guanosine2251-2'-O)-methyltransferase
MKKHQKKSPKKGHNYEYWMYGYHAVSAALNNSTRLKSQHFITPEINKKLKSNGSKIESENLKTNIVQRSEIDHLLGKGINHQGVCLKVEKNKRIELKEFLENQSDDNSSIIILDQLEDSQNVGAIFRSALAFNIDGIILTDNQSVSENSFIAKTACGGIDKVPFTTVPNLSSSIRMLKDNGYWVYGLDGSGKSSIEQTNFPKKVVFIFGSESTGMRHLTKSLCDEIVKINISKDLESLNVSNSAAVLFFHLNAKNS